MALYRGETRIGGIGNATTYVTQAEYDLLPSTKLTNNVNYGIYEGDAGEETVTKFIKNGESYTVGGGGGGGGGGGSNPALKLLGGQPGVPLYYLGQSIGTHVLRFNDYIILGSWQGGNNATRMMILDMDGNVVMSFNPGGTYGGGYNFYDCGNNRLKIDHNTYSSWSSTWVDIPNQTYTTTDPGWTAGSTDPTTSYDISPAYLANIGYDARYCIMLLAGQVGTQV